MGPQAAPNPAVASRPPFSRVFAKARSHQLVGRAFVRLSAGLRAWSWQGPCLRSGPTYLRGAMRPDKMTTKAQEAVRAAADLASRRGNPELYPEHLVRAILEQEDGIGGTLVQLAGADPAELLRL